MALDKRSIRTEDKTDAQVQLTDGTDEVDVATHGSAHKTKSLQLLGSDGTNARRVRTDSSGNVQTVQVESGSAVAEHQETAALAAQATETLAFADIATSTTGKLREVVVSSENAWEAVVEKYDGATATTIAKLRGDAGQTVIWEPRDKDAPLYQQLGGTGKKFRIVAKNINPSGVGNSETIAATLAWREE